MRYAPMSVTVSITPVYWQLRSSGFLLSKFLLEITAIHCIMWAGYISWYSDWLRAGRYRDRIPVGTRFTVLFRPALSSIQPPVKFVPDISRVEKRPRRYADH